MKDRRFRRNRAMLRPASIRARWIEGEAFRLLRLGFSYRQIAEIITALGAGDLRPEVAGIQVPADVSFPPGYSIGYRAVHKLLTRALTAYPMLQLRESRKLWVTRIEEAWALNYPAMRKGSPRAIEVGMKIAERAAKLLGLDMRMKVALPDDEAKGIPLEALRALMSRVDEEAIDMMVDVAPEPAPRCRAIRDREATAVIPRGHGRGDDSPARRPARAWRGCCGRPFRQQTGPRGRLPLKQTLHVKPVRSIAFSSAVSELGYLTDSPGRGAGFARRSAKAPSPSSVPTVPPAPEGDRSPCPLRVARIRVGSPLVGWRPVHSRNRIAFGAWVLSLSGTFVIFKTELCAGGPAASKNAAGICAHCALGGGKGACEAVFPCRFKGGTYTGHLHQVN